MPIDYKKYPVNWLSEIRPAILLRANNKCEFCGFEHNQIVWKVKYHGKIKWFESKHIASLYPSTTEYKNGKYIEYPLCVKVILTIAHLDHDETNHDVSMDRLKALCQLCHLRYDAKEKYRRSLLTKNPRSEVK